MTASSLSINAAHRSKSDAGCGEALKDTVEKLHVDFPPTSMVGEAWFESLISLIRPGLGRKAFSNPVRLTPHKKQRSVDLGQGSERVFANSERRREGDG